MSVRQNMQPITRDAIVVLTPPADPSHRIAGLLSPFDPAAASAVMGAAASLPGRRPPHPVLAAGPLLDELLAPMTRATFVAENWEQRPVLIRSPSRPDPIRLHGPPGLIHADAKRSPRLMFDRRDLDAGIAAGIYAPSSVSLSQRGQLVDTSAYTRMAASGGRSRQVLDPQRVAELLASEGSIRVLELQSFDPRVAALARELGSALGCRIGVNVYYSSQGQGHFSAMREGVHWDTHDVFAVQTRGRKAWSVFAPVVEQPIGQHRSFYYEIPATEPLISAVLEEGDVLYIPRGFVHQVKSPADSDSIHLAIGVYTVTWSELFEVLLRRALLERGHEPSWRESVDIAALAADPAGVQDRITAMLAELGRSVATLDHAALLEDAIVATQTLAPTPPAPRPRLAADTVLRRTPGLAFVREEGGRAVLKLPSRKILFPLRAGPTLHALLAGEACALGSLARDLSPQEAEVIAEVLLFHGFLEVAT